LAFGVFSGALDFRSTLLAVVSALAFCMLSSALGFARTTGVCFSSTTTCMFLQTVSCNTYDFVLICGHRVLTYIHISNVFLLIHDDTEWYMAGRTVNFQFYFSVYGVVCS